MNNHEKLTMMAMRKNDISATQVNVKMHRKKFDAGDTSAITNRTTVSNSDKQVDKPLEQEESTSESPIIDKARVGTIRRAIEKGDYKIDSKRTAEKLLQLEDDIWSDKGDR